MSWLSNWLSKRRDPPLFILAAALFAYLAAIIILTGVGGTHIWARYAVALLCAPVPIALVILLMLAYGKWIFKMVTLWRAEKKEFFDPIVVYPVSAVVIIAALIWAAYKTANQWVMWEALKYGLCFVVVTVISYFACLYHRRWKDRKLYRSIGRALREYTQNHKLQS